MTVDEYIAAQPAERHDALHQLRRVILNAEPDAVESISYGMPTYRLPNGHPVYFAGWKHHVSLHDIPVLDAAVEAAVVPFRSGKDTLKFPNADGIPFDLVANVVAAIASRPSG